MNRSFRQWVNEKWYEHKEECSTWKAPSCKDAQEYFRKNRWFLKKRFKEEEK